MVDIDLSKFNTPKFLFDLSMKETEKLNQIVNDYGEFFGPSLIYLLYYGPGGVATKDLNVELGNLPFSNESVEKLERRIESIERRYNMMLTNVGAITNSITRHEFNYKKLQGDPNKLLIEREEMWFKKILRKNINDLDRIDAETKTLINDDKNTGAIDNLKIYHDKGKNYLLISRIKQDKSMINKYSVGWEKLTGIQKENYYRFLTDLMEDERATWTDERYGELEDKYGYKMMEGLLLGDTWGLSIVDLEYDRYMKRSEELKSAGSKLDIKGYSIVTERLDDHTRRVTDQGRPGGLDFTIVSKSEPNFPVEVKFYGPISVRLKYYGEHSDHLYKTRGKKTNETYNED